jgi:hypothetical protein
VQIGVRGETLSGVGINAVERRAGIEVSRLQSEVNTGAVCAGSCTNCYIPVAMIMSVDFEWRDGSIHI